MNSSLRRGLAALAILMLPSALARSVLRILGHKVGPDVRFGFSLLLVESLTLQANIRIGHLNFIRVRRLAMREGAYFGRGNIVHGPLSIFLANRAGIGNGNKIVRGPKGIVAHGPAQLRLGELAKITADHRLDCTCSIVIGNFSTVAGTSSQFWTHGYVHDAKGPGRYRIDGSILIGHNVYVGSACIITTGVHIVDSVIVGAGATVARNLLEPGMYVSTGLRKLDRPLDPLTRGDLQEVQAPELCERVFTRQANR